MRRHHVRHAIATSVHNIIKKCVFIHNITMECCNNCKYCLCCLNIVVALSILFPQSPHSTPLAECTMADHRYILCQAPNMAIYNYATSHEFVIQI